MDECRIWEILNQAKIRLFNSLRRGTQHANKVIMNYQRFEKAFKEIPDRYLLKEWEKIEEEHKDNPQLVRRLRGILYEALFYFACLENQRVLFDAELVTMDDEESPFEEEPGWIEATPLYGIIPSLHHLKQEGKWQRKVPQTNADFLFTYVDENGPNPLPLLM